MRLHLTHPDHGPLLCGNPSTAVAVTTEDKATCLTCLRSAAADHRRRLGVLRSRIGALHRERNPPTEPLPYSYVVTFVNPWPEGHPGAP